MLSRRRDRSQRGKRSSLTHFRREWKVVFASALIASISATAEAGGLVLIAAAAEQIGTPGAVELEMGPLALDLTFVQSLVISALLIAASGAGRVLANYLTIRKRAALTRRWRTQLVGGFLASDFAHQSEKRRGEVLETAGQHAAAAGHVLEILANALNSFLSMLILVAGAYALDPVVATILLVGGAGLLLVLRPMTKRAKRLSARVASIDVEFGNHLDEMVRMAKDIEVFGGSRWFGRKAAVLARESATTSQKVFLLNRSAPVIYQVFGLLLLLGALAVSSTINATSITAIGGSALLLLRGISYGQQLSSFQQNIARWTPYLENVLHQLEVYEARTNEFGRLEIASVETIEFDSVSYTYDEGGSEAILDISVVVKRPGITGLVGASGSGKSTLAQLILRLRRPTTGSILVNGIDSAEFAAESWRRTVSFVPQEAELIHGTLTENVAFFREWVTEAEVRAAIEAVGLSDLVESLEEGFDTIIGPSLRQVSGGQKQRIGIARALVGRPSLFVLDEPTSALDDESEAWVMKAIRSLSETCAVIIITHRASTRSHCDILIRLENGRLSSIDPVS